MTVFSETPFLNGKPTNTDVNESSPAVFKSSCPEPIAICGISLRLPGGIHNGEDFWDLLVNGRDARTKIPASRFAIEGFDSSLGGPGAIHTRHGYFLEDDLSRLDTSFFSMSRNELERCDPQQRQLLEVVRECFEDAGEVNYRGQPIGCYIGTFGQDWHEMSVKEPHQTGNYTVTGYSDLILANRVSYEYDLHGPSLVIKTGCSASLVALHEACRALQSGDASAAIVGGTSLIMSPNTTSFFSNEGILSPDASCNTFDASANGFARAEGITAIYIKRFEDALRDGNPIRAVIRATGSNSDGRSQGLMSPNSESHEELMRKVYQQANLDPRSTAFVECHGTGTAIGDPIETRAVGNVFGENGVYIGSVKPNVGHSEGCSGLTSLIKAVLSLEHRMIPPNIKFVKPNPKIPFAEKRLTVPLRPTPFPNDRAERISVNSFAIGGSNAHVILDSKSGFSYGTSGAGVADGADNENGVDGESGTTGLKGVDASSASEILLFSLNSSASVKRQIDSYRDYISKHPNHVADVAYTLALRREALPYRAFTIVKDGEVVETSGVVKAASTAPGITMVFSGQGAQWSGMGRDLILTDLAFRQDIVRMDNVLQRLKKPPTWSILDLLEKPATASQIHSAEFAQPLSTALQLALVLQFERLGILPIAVVGHSSGEIAAAYAAGYISLDYAITVAYYRGYVTTHGASVRVGGKMAAVGLGAADVSPFLLPGVCVACENSPMSSTISGEGNAVLRVMASIQEEYPETLCRLLKVDVAYHSHHMAAMEKEYLALIEAEDNLRFLESGRGHAKALFISSVTCASIGDVAGFAPPYWAANLVSPVRFSSALSIFLAQSTWAAANTLLEIGPHSTLSGPVRQICANLQRQCNYIPSQVRDNNSVASLLSALGKLFQGSAPVSWKAMFPNNRKTLPGLPRYSWDHSNGSFWYESRLSREWRTREYPHHCLLGIRVVESPDSAPQWRNVLHLEHVPWISDHKVRQDVVFPFAGYIAMAGEAVRQATGCKTGYQLRHVVARTGLVMTDAKPVEIVTTLRKQKLTDSDYSDWFDFAIISHNGLNWVTHCEGQAKSLERTSAPTLALPSAAGKLPRHVIKSRFYEAIARIGIIYGPGFQLLDDISSSTTECVAEAKLSQLGTQASQSFHMHPASIDGCIQLLVMANAKGLCRNFQQLLVPTLIESIEVSRGAVEMYAKARTVARNYESAVVECLAGDDTVALRMSGLRLTPYDGGSSGGSIMSDVHAAARLQWVPDFDFADITKLFRPPSRDRTERRLQETLTLLCTLESAGKIAGLNTCQPHFAQYRDWLHLQISKVQAGEYALVEEAAQYAILPPQSRRELLETTYTKLLEFPGKHALSIGIKRICDHADAIFMGQRDTLDILMQDDILTEIYNEYSFGYSDFVRLLSNTRPNLRILEVGAGTGGTTEQILRDLVDNGGFPLYSQYMFTDISAGFFPQARERFAYANNVDYQVFDISKDGVEQGFAAASYDLILAPNVVHATPCVKDTLENLKHLLKPDGMLLLTEISTVTQSPNYVFGNFSGWWLGADDGRIWEPYVVQERWDKDLKAAGFTGVNVAVPDDEIPYQLCMTILSRPQPAEGNRLSKKSLTVLCQSPNDGPSLALVSTLRKQGWDVSECELGEKLPPSGQDIIACVDLETRFFDEDLSEASFTAFKDLLRHLKDERVLWLTRRFQVKCQDPRAAQTLGVARTVRAELNLPLFTLEIDYEQEPKAADLVIQVFNKIRTVQDEDIINPDREFVVDDGVIYIGRYHPFSLTEEMSSGGTSETSKSLHIGKPGTLESLEWRDEPVAITVDDDAVEVDIHAAGLNFRDLLLALGVISPHPSEARILLGLEATGIIRRVGARVTTFHPGDRVMVISTTSTLSTRLVVPATSAVRIPDAMSFNLAATVPACFATVLYALLDVGRLQEGQTVLVHSACGGIGLAALQVCRAVGAEVFATVGSEKKIKHLMEYHGIARNRIFSSRDSSFEAGILRETGGRGIDLVLNSLSGELLHKSWECVAEYGTMIELSKRDLWGAGKLDMAPFLANRSYAAVDIHQFVRERPEKIGQVLTQYVDMYNRGQLQPLDPVSYFDAEVVEQAFRHLQNGDHIGKIVVTIPKDASRIHSTPHARLVTLDPEATYLMVGGSKGLGGSIATWLVERGARSLTFLSRSTGTNPETKALFEELQAMGCSVSAVAGSVDNQEDVRAAISSSGKSVKGVFQLAMVLSDSPLIDMNLSEWQAAIGPKVRGTWNLHHTLADQSLDFFWMASSLVTVIDQPGQGNYSAGCSFLEAFCQYRHGLGLPATVLNICPVGGVGYVAENPHARRNTKAQGLVFLGEQEFLDFVQLNILHPNGDGVTRSEEPAPCRVVPLPWQNYGQVLMGLRSELHLDDPNNRTNWRRDRRMGMYHNVWPDDKDGAVKGASQSSAVALFLGRTLSVADEDGEAAIKLLAQPESATFLAREIGKKIYELILEPMEDSEEIDTSLTLSQIGLDSLMAIELRRWFRRAVGIVISVLEIMGSGSLIQLARLTTEKLVEKLAL
ncbi:polyketide synthase [Hypomontagnella monticulosa]|nr:polyketide synthase [Hypomontagnella monticulosa]